MTRFTEIKSKKYRHITKHDKIIPTRITIDIFGLKDYLKYIKKGKRVLVEGKLQGISGTVRIIFQKIGD